MERDQLLKGKSAEVGRRAENNAKNILLVYLEPDQAESYASDYGSRKVFRYLERREVGLANDERSVSPGLTLFVTPDGSEVVAKLCAIKNYHVDEEHINAVNDNLVSIEFPAGIYETMDKGILFAATTTKTGRAVKFFTLPNEAVVRIEGSVGELWQNPKFNWEGARKV